MPVIESMNDNISHANMVFLLSGCMAGLKKSPSWNKIKGREIIKPARADTLRYVIKTSAGARNIKFSMVPYAGSLIMSEILSANMKEKAVAVPKKIRLAIMRLRNSSRCSIIDILLWYISSVILPQAKFTKGVLLEM